MPTWTFTVRIHVPKMLHLAQMYFVSQKAQEIGTAWHIQKEVFWKHGNEFVSKNKKYCGAV